MITILSPAKRLDEKSPLPKLDFSQPDFEKEARKLIKILRDFEVPGIQSLMDLNENLAELNYQRYKEFRLRGEPEQARPAIMTFRGDVYLGLAPENFDQKTFKYAQEHLRILSGLYGLLRPLDLIQPYRLEMGTSLQNEKGKNLYEFWGNKLTRKLNKELKAAGSKALVNLASNEYVSAVALDKIKVPVISPVFLDESNGKFKILSFFAKKARGIMAGYLLENQIQNPEGIKTFDAAGYQYDPKRSKENEPVFIRPESDRQ